MAKDAAITVRLPLELKRRLELRARAQRRSVSAQMVHELEALLTAQPGGEVSPSSVPALGRFAGGKATRGRAGARKVPSEADFREVRALLWGTLAARS